MPSAPYLGRSGVCELDESVFGVGFNEALVHECVRADLNALRQGTSSTKTRGQVRGGGAKPWRQKGTGRARAGSSRSPIWTGGGITFGPSPRHFTFKVNRKARRAALRSSLSLHASRGSLAVLADDALAAPSTKQAAQLLAGWEHIMPTLVVVADNDATTIKSFRNLVRVTVRSATDVGIADLIGAATLVIAESAVSALVTRGTGERSETAQSVAQEQAAA